MFGAIGGFITFIIIAVIILFILSTCIRIVPQAQALVVERLGAYLGTYSVGIHFLVPFIDRVAKKVNLKQGSIRRRRRGDSTKYTVCFTALRDCWMRCMWTCPPRSIRIWILSS